MDFKGKSDNDLMKEFSSCSRMAYEEIVKRYDKRLFNFLLKGLINDRDDAEDIVQKSLIRVYENKFLYKPTHQFSTWVYTICRNFALNEKRNTRWMSIGAVFGNDEPGDVSQNCLEVMEENESNVTMKRLLMNLDVKYREVITMRFLDELTYEEIHVITGKEINTLKSLCKRGLEKIRIGMEQISVEGS